MPTSKGLSPGFPVQCSLMTPTDNAPAAPEPAPMWQDRFAIVLVEPENSLNIGAVARAMMNLGFRDLRLVAPPQYDPDRAGVTARHSRALLDTMTVHATFEAAIADCGEVVGLALQTSQAAHFVTLPQWTAGLPSRPLPRVGLVFGTEDDGLSDAQLTQCRWVVRIPSQEAFTSFNLAQSVLLVLYSLTVAFADAPPPPAPHDPRRDLERVFPP